MKNYIDKNNLSEIRIAMYGDISLNDEFVIQSKNKTLGNIFKEFHPINEESDLIIANLESPLMGSGKENELKSPRLKTSKEVICKLLDLKPNIIILANNHIYDCLDDGFTNTVNFLHQNNIKTVGAGISQKEASQPVFIETKGKKICILAYVDKLTNPNLPEDAKIYLNWLDSNKVIADIKEYKNKVDLVIISIHWGDRIL